MSDAGTPFDRGARPSRRGDADMLDRARVDAAARRGLRDAPVTRALIAVNVVVFAYAVFVSGSFGAAWSVPEEVLKWLGANDSLSTIADSRLETLVTSCFLHASIFHLALNVLALWVVAPFVERIVGPARFATLYLAAGIGASASSAIVGRLFGTTLSVGASGAICGIMGAGIVLGVRAEGWRSPHAIAMARWLLLLLAVGLVKYLRGDMLQIDNAAHVGGALAGAVAAITWQGAPYARRTQHAIVAGCAIAVAASGVIVWARDVTDPYLFLDVDGRTRAAYDALGAGNCAAARSAIFRALAMDPKSHVVRERVRDVEAACAGLSNRSIDRRGAPHVPGLTP